MITYGMTPEEQIEHLHKILADIFVEVTFPLWDYQTNLFTPPIEDLYKMIGEKVEEHIASAFGGDYAEMRSIVQRYHPQALDFFERVVKTTISGFEALKEHKQAMQGSEYVQ